jgi:membrane-associated protein
MLDLSTPAKILTSLEGLSYFIIFLIFIAEGPIVNFAAAFASSLGFFNVFIILVLAITGNIVGDTMYYFIGKFGKKGIIDKFVRKSFNSSKIKRLNKYLQNNPGKTLTVIKLTPAFPIPGLILAGAANMKFTTFVFYSILISAIQCSFITVLGFYSGAAFSLIFEYFRYGSYLAAGLVILMVGFWLLLKFLSKKVTDRIEKI